MKKTTINKILVPVDFSATSESAMLNAIIIAKRINAEVHIMSVIDPNWQHFTRILETMTNPPSKSDIDTAVLQKLRIIQERTKITFGITPAIHISTGQIQDEIISYAEKENIDLIVMGTHGVTGYNEFFVGSNAQRLINLSEIPVLTLNNTCNNPEFRKILIPIDNSRFSREKVNLSIAFADIFNSTVHVVGLFVSNDKAEEAKFRHKIASVEETLAAKKLTVKTTIIRGKNLAQAALSYATKNSCDLIVINTGHESKLTSYFLYDYSGQIVNHSAIPVLSIRHSPSRFRIDSPGSPDY